MKIDNTDLKIDYICYSVPYVGQTDFEINSTDTSNTKANKKREKKIYDKAHKLGVAIVYDRYRGCFYKDGKMINVCGKVVLPRTGISSYERNLLVALKACSAISVQTVSDVEKLKHWPRYVQPSKRKVYEITFQDLVDNCDYFKEIFNVLHVSTVNSKKVNSTIIKYGWKKDKFGEYFYSEPEIDLAPSEKIYVTDAFQRIADYQNNLAYTDYKVFVVDGKMASISRSLTSKSIPIDDEIVLFAHKQIQKNKKNPEFPKTYVMDIAEMFIDGARQIDVVGYKSVCSSELSIDNDLTDIVMATNCEEEVLC